MNFLDVCGPPGSGKSTLCDPIWGPHAIDFEGVNQFHPTWAPYLKVCERLMREVRDHPSYDAMGRMLWRSLRKIAVVQELIADPMQVYIQTALAQRGLGFGWRLNDLGKTEMVREYFQVMPVSLGVAMTKAPVEIVEARNNARPVENRHWMVAKMQPAMQIAREVFSERGIPFLEVDTTQPVDAARQQLINFANSLAGNTKAVRPRDKVADVPVMDKPGPASRTAVPVAHPDENWWV